MLNVKQTKTGIYYIHDYYPSRYKNLSEEQEEDRRFIWNLKDLKDDAVSRSANELIKTIRSICKDVDIPRVGLVAVPPSKVNKESPVRKSIRLLYSWYEDGIIKNFFGFDKIICDYSNLLTRIIDIPTSHEGTRATYRQQMESMVCNKNLLSMSPTIFFLIDDITTSGTTMRACMNILAKNVRETDIIICFALARTVPDGVGQ